MKETIRFLMRLIAVILFVGSTFTLFPANSYSQLVVVGEGIRFTPLNPKPGQTVFMDVRFRVEGSGAPVPINFSIIDVTRTPDPDHSNLSGHTYAPGRSFTINIGHRIPDPVPPRICFNVYAHFPGTGLRSTLLIQNACLNARLHLLSPGTGYRVVEATGGRPGEPTIVRGTVIGRYVNFPPMNLNPERNRLNFGVMIDVLGEITGGDLILGREGISVVRTSVGLAPGNNRVAIFDPISVTSGTDLIPSRLNYDIKINFPTCDDRNPPASLLIGGIRLETQMYVLSEGRGQRITLPESLKTLPRSGVKPVQPRI
jgi:hypothetical protein